MSRPHRVPPALPPSTSSRKTTPHELRADTAQYNAHRLLGYVDELDMMVRLTYSLEAVRRELAVARTRLREAVAKLRKRDQAPSTGEFANMVDQLVAAALQLTGDPAEEHAQTEFEARRLAVIEAYDKVRSVTST
jgi:hypothetical protein